MTRLTAEFWVQAYLTRLRLYEIPAFVVAQGAQLCRAVSAMRHRQIVAPKSRVADVNKRVT